MNDEDAAMLRQEIGRVNVRVDILEQTVLPLLAVLLGDQVRGETLEDMLASIQSTRHRALQMTQTANVDETAHQRMVREVCVQGIGALFDKITALTAGVAFSIESEN